MTRGKEVSRNRGSSASSPSEHSDHDLSGTSLNKSHSSSALVVHSSAPVAGSSAVVVSSSTPISYSSSPPTAPKPISSSSSPPHNPLRSKPLPLDFDPHPLSERRAAFIQRVAIQREKKKESSARFLSA